ncbi:MAG TPA: glycosyltransferase [Streptosporangiaceae bacterium]|nr:glycosyltransferase [Streptosporangiaceae bacterium]
MEVIGPRSPLSVAICTNRPWNIRYMLSAAASLSAGDELLVVLDVADADCADLADELGRRGARLLRNGSNRGLSYSRNQALAECAHRILVYLDDDITIGSETLDAIGRAAAAGAGIIGVLLVPVFPTACPWWLTGGQYHYLGVHHGIDGARTWGACMAVDAVLARRHGLNFRQDLGRRGRALQSGDDTSFLAELRALGATERFLTDVQAIHHVSADRQRLSYLIRRAWWQGRSERRRRCLTSAIGKEWNRNSGPGPSSARRPRRTGLAIGYLSAVVAGGCYEAASRMWCRLAP